VGAGAIDASMACGRADLDGEARFTECRGALHPSTAGERTVERSARQRRGGRRGGPSCAKGNQTGPGGRSLARTAFDRTAAR